MGGDAVQMSRFFVSPESLKNGRVTIAGEDLNHIKNVLRLSPGDNITVCDGNCNDYLVRIEHIDKTGVHCLIEDSWENRNEMSTRIVLYQGLAKGDKMGMIIQKSVELGVYAIVPVITERTVVRVENHQDAGKKANRWQKIAEEAAKQCNRGIVPRVYPPALIKHALDEMAGFQLAVIPYENEKANGLKQYISGKKYDSIAVMIGPEGGFTENEVALAKEKGVVPVTLGPRILRTETAGIAVLSILAYEAGGMD